MASSRYSPWVQKPSRPTTQKFPAAENNNEKYPSIKHSKPEGQSSLPLPMCTNSLLTYERSFRYFCLHEKGLVYNCHERFFQNIIKKSKNDKTSLHMYVHTINCYVGMRNFASTTPTRLPNCKNPGASISSVGSHQIIPPSQDGGHISQPQREGRSLLCTISQASWRPQDDGPSGETLYLYQTPYCLSPK